MQASEYKKHSQNKAILIDLKLPSGVVWKVRTPLIEQFIASGRLPAALTAKMLSAAKQNQESTKPADELSREMLKKLTPDEILQNMAFGCELIQYSAVEPRVVLKPDSDGTLPEDAILPTDILPEDFAFLLQWVFSGGGQSDSLDTFRGE